MGVLGPYAVDTMKPDIDKMRNEFFKKSLSVGYHNVKYTWMQIMLMIINCIRSLESFEEGAKSPSAQTLRDRLNLEGTWLASFHASVLKIAQFTLKKFGRYLWWISIDETYVPFFGNRKKLNSQLQRKKLGAFVHGYRADTPGAAGIAIGTALALGAGFAAKSFGFPMLSIRVDYVVVIAALLFSFIIGTVAGFVPAMQAAKLKPVDALRCE